MELDKSISVAQFEKSTKAFTDLHYEVSIKDAKRDGSQANNDGNYRQN